jgi:hypothetical protein
MRKIGWLLAQVATVGCLAAGMLSCGGGTDTVIRVSHSSISKADINHWMKVLVAGDYRGELGKPAPAGLVSDPPDYRACIKAGNSLVRTRNTQGTATLCRQLHEAAKKQAVAFLTDALWHIEDAKEHGEAVTAREIARRFRLLQERERPGPGAMEHYLAEVHRTIADEYYLLKRNILTEKALVRLQREGLHLSGNKLAIARVTNEWLAKWTARTSCQPGYVTQQCKQFKGESNAAPAPDTILQQLAGRQKSAA